MCFAWLREKFEICIGDINWWYVRNGLFTDFRGLLWFVLFQYVVKSLDPRWYSSILFQASLLLLVICVIFSIFLTTSYVHHVFHREWPKGCKLWRWLRVYYHISKLVYPLSILWRLLTVWMRVYPNVIMLGGTRCATTTLSHYLLDLPFVKGPFTPLLMPELSGKECYYMIGDYFGGCIHPFFYRMCFPTIFSYWYCQWRYGRPPIIMDSTPLYLVSSVYTCKLFARLTEYYHHRSKNNEHLKLKFIVSIREPVEQNVSWFAFCTRAQYWGTSAGLDDFYADEGASVYVPYRVQYLFTRALMRLCSATESILLRYFKN
ncbi:hypothetical protein RFI_20731 [Reticulomyxa filosa]|uniref:Sulfotransferase n=1 Tax=Reticulomyxa filosa TaxID=46433 RepID=X6MRZ7_RETFI|nr:hypothetical protein RFI_20731 [Reticulomyxa filosa]|eukprot:ETO16609.1 hypothetical protein RFI_20731 [Reticulomyxa filosa]